MNKIEAIRYKDCLPDSFFSIADKVYQGITFRPIEDKDVITSLFHTEATRNEIIIYTDNSDIRLTGIFPKGESVAYFGFWETKNNLQQNIEAFAMLEADAKLRKRRSIIGPLNFNTFHNYRLRLADRPSWNMFDREPVNPDYYSKILDAISFTVKSEFESRLIRKEDIPNVYVTKAALLKEIERIPFDFIPLNETNWVIYEAQIFELINAIFSENPMYRSITQDQFKLLYNRDYARKLCPYSSVMFSDHDTGQLAAISMCHPNYYSLYPAVKNPEFSKDFQKLETKILVAKTVGVHPGFRRRGLMNLLGAYGMLSFRDWYDEVLFGLMRSDNYSLHFTDKLKYDSAKYALYEKQVK